ncbi:MAG: efflux RND transporter periplasmic adaptor subunit [Caulobacteraceae bacterium]|nr:MAG: efflux RND transporter periplasmic adaptor subunit [Caulobacteraceae bacterium]
MVRRHFFLIAAGAVLLLMVVLGGLKLATGGEAKGKGAGGAGGRAANVAQVVVVSRPFADRISVLGVAKGRQSVTITSDTAELVTAVHFRDGQAVSRGQILVTLKATEQDAGVAEAQARENQAERAYARWKTLADKGIAPRATAEQYLAELETARASTGAARARKGDRVIRAPFAGVVGLSDIAPGALISPGSPIVSLDDLGLIRVDFDVPDRYLGVLRPGSPIVATPDAYPDQTFTGRIAQVDTRIDTATRAITARAEFSNSGGSIKPGMMMRVNVSHGQRDALAVPESAIQYVGDQAFVFVITPRGEGSVARKVLVTPGASEGGFVELREGVKVGDKLVADGLNRLQDGQQVRLPGKGGPQGKGGPDGKGGAPKGKN